jgi:hypothetical protein
MIGASLALVLLPVALLVAAVNLWRVWRHRHRRALTPALIALTIGVLLAVGIHHELHYWDGVELNPELTAEDLLGTWQREQETLSLLADGTFTRSDGSRGRWARDDLTPSSFTVGGERWVAFRKEGHLRILRYEDGDPDSWNLSAAFARSR